ncbi:uncharacterized protein [Nicotiana tomentosiformis]|uniref:uncharacterized protein n=1 Tax=Nicotiana tomentosiformis TaxID=4098 RepID=UPI00388C4B9E
MTLAPVASPPAQPSRGGAQLARGRARGGGRSSGGQARLYAFPARPDVIASDAMITGIVSVCHREASILFEPGSTYSHVSSYFVRYLDMPRESLVSPICVSTPVGDTFIVYSVYRSCVVAIWGLETRVDLLLLSMVDFDVILDMDWLSPCHAILDYHTKTERYRGCQRSSGKVLKLCSKQGNFLLEGSTYGWEGVFAIFGLCERC